MKVLSYEAWKESESGHLKGAMVVCPTCDGDGEYEEECDCCGAVSEHECDNCNEDGKVLFDKLGQDEVRKILNYPKYIEAVQTDLQKLIGWMGDKGITIAVENGFRVFQEIGTKALKVTE